MTLSNINHKQSETISDAAINGLFGGISAGVVMLLFLVVVGLLSGEGITTVLNRFTIPGQTANPITSLFLHLGTSAIYGGMYGMLLRQIPVRLKTPAFKLTAGLAFGLILYILAAAVLLPGTRSTLAELSPLVFAEAHGIYGLVLGRLTHA